ncbi:DUF3300 domain-containing protein [Jeongeupia naejangsanensis]|uniref:DUF3300 domain-containing protein n=1 Tax=Jeongeupia naejangsanensis TaxID=613195 RepID=A0ABS2BKF9_9NEIS|nr:DUF3300 domain-containing protein [Jeongeupia naejangsanensis]MBM3116099.1 DUF3300 domain-containing protein [Jeongeupia naejangsanensis]
MQALMRALLFVVLLVCGHAQAANGQAGAATFKPEEIEQLVAPIALYPDSLLAQVLMASTYPLEVVEAQRWRQANPNLKDKALEDALQKQSWDASVKSLTAFPQVLQMMNDKLDWTQKLGDAFLAQQKDVLDAAQRLRTKAEAQGNLKSSKEQTVTTDSSGSTTVIKIEPAQPEVVYVPTYNPTVVYGPWPYPAYTPYYWYPPGYVAGTAFFSFTAGVIVGSALWGGCNWGRGDVDINVNRYNNFNRTNISNSNWNHNVDHRRGVQYRDNATQQRYRGNRTGVDSREAFRGRADQERGQLGNVDKGSLRERPDAGGRDRQHSAGNRDARTPSQGGINRDARNPSQGGIDHGTRDRQTAADRGSNRDHAGQRNNSFNQMDRGGAARQDSMRGASSRSQISRPVPSRGGGRR